MRAFGRALVIAAVAANVCVPSASAWTISSSPTALTVTGAPATPNALTLSDGTSGSLIVSDDAGAAHAGALPAGCTSITPSRVQCQATAQTTATIVGGASADTLSNDASARAVVLDGGVGADTLYAGSRGDVLAGGGGDDAIYGGAGADSLSGGDGADQLYGADGADVLDSGAGDDQLYGGAGDDTIAAGAGTDLVSAGGGNDGADAGDGDDTLAGGDGDDVLSGSSGDDVIDGQAGNDASSGDLGNDAVTDGDGNDALAGGDGNDMLRGGSGADTLRGGPGADDLDGGDQADTQRGDDGDDRLTGGEGSDDLEGGDGNDAIVGGNGADRLAGGTGVDVADYSAVTSAVSLSPNGTSDDGSTGEGDDVASDVEVLVGGSADDALTLGSASGALHGGPGADVLTGGPGVDALDGGAGDDTLDGGPGADAIAGGAGTDTVTYASRASPVTVAPGTATSGSPGERDAVSASVENGIGGTASDTLIGAHGVVNDLRGGGGNDTFRVGGDPLLADVVGCGTGADTVHADVPDTVEADCETLFLGARKVRPSPPPRVFVRARVARASASGIVTLHVRCAAATRGVCSGTATLTFRRGRAAGTGSGRLRALPGADQRVAIRLTPRSRRLLARDRRRVKGRVRIAVGDVLGRRTVRNLAVTVLPPGSSR